MTTPALAKTIDGKRRYPWPPTEPYEFVADNVTGLLSDGLPAPALAHWMTREAIKRCRKLHDMLPRMTEREAVQFFSRSSDRIRDAKASVGTIVHTAIEAHTEGRQPRNLGEKEQGYFDAALRFLEERQPRVEMAERTVFSRRHHYAGTFDQIAHIDGELCLVDFKTGGIYEKHVLQLAAYAFADFIGDVNGVETPLPEVRRGCLVQLKDDGTYRLFRPALTEAIFARFLAVRDVATWIRSEGKAALGLPERRASKQIREAA